jgi:hypothetical protein
MRTRATGGIVDRDDAIGRQSWSARRDAEGGPHIDGPPEGGLFVALPTMATADRV